MLAFVFLMASMVRSSSDNVKARLNRIPLNLSLSTSLMESFVTSPHQQLSDADLECGRDQALAQMQWTRQYTLQLIESVPHSLWYQQPAQLPTHLAWQVAHLAVSQYGLMLFRQRGRSPGDLEIMPGWLRKNFGRGSQPAAPTDASPEPQELLQRLHAIHEQALQEARNLSAATLRESIDMPFAAYPIKLGALLFCPVHESIHAGQIGMLRRAHGLPPLR